MLGMILWKKGEGRGPELLRVLGVPFVCVRIERSRRPSGLRRQLRRAVRQLERRGVSRAVLPRELPRQALEQAGRVQPVSTLPLRQLLAADWTAEELQNRHITGSCVRIAVAAEEMSLPLARTVTALSLRYRYVLLHLPRGGEQLCRTLRREYGAAVQLNPGREALAGAEAAVLFSPGDGWEESCPVQLRLWEEGPLPPLVLPPVTEEQLPADADRGMLLSALLEAGALRPQWLTLGEEKHGETGEAVQKLPESFPFPWEKRP